MYVLKSKYRSKLFVVVKLSLCVQKFFLSSFSLAMALDPPPFPPCPQFYNFFYVDSYLIYLLLLLETLHTCDIVVTQWILCALYTVEIQILYTNVLIFIEICWKNKIVASPHFFSGGGGGGGRIQSGLKNTRWLSFCMSFHDH